MLAVPQWTNNDRDLVAGNQACGLPPLAHQFDRGSHLNSPFDGLGAGIARVRHEHLNPAVRIRPLKFLNRADQRDLFRLVEHRARVVCECGASHHRQNDDERHSQSGSHLSIGSSVLKLGDYSLTDATQRRRCFWLKPLQPALSCLLNLRFSSQGI